MKIYIQDLSWAGCIIVIASSEEEARTKMQAKSTYYEPDRFVEECEITPDFFYRCWGDS